jgi:hypothetical protein
MKRLACLVSSKSTINLLCYVHWGAMDPKWTPMQERVKEFISGQGDWLSEPIMVHLLVSLWLYLWCLVVQTIFVRTSSGTLCVLCCYNNTKQRPRRRWWYAFHIYHLFTISGTSRKCSIKTKANQVTHKAVLESWDNLDHLTVLVCRWRPKIDWDLAISLFAMLRPSYFEKGIVIF